MPEEVQPGFRYCMACGDRIAFAARQCPHCGQPTAASTAASKQASKKKFGTAVALCAVFGVAGIHHFYIGNILHGMIDLALLVVAVALLIQGDSTGNPGLVGLGALVLIIDAIHSAVVFFRLIIGKQRDGHGLLIRYPGQG